MGGELFFKQRIMSIETMKNASFKSPSITDWKEKVEESLKGKKLESLNRGTYENIILKPLYSMEDYTGSAIAFPGGEDFRRGNSALGYNYNPWKIAQQISYNSLEDLEDKLNIVLEKGQSAAAFQLSNTLLQSKNQFEAFLGELSNKTTLAIETMGYQKEFADTLNESIDAMGYIAEDPLSQLVKSGSYSLVGYLEKWPEIIDKLDQYLPNIKTILVDTTPYHNGGANAVQELGIALGTAVYYLEELSSRGIEVEKIFKKFVFKFQIGANFFMELSKLRAARVLWDKIGEAYGIPTEYRAMEIIGETSSFTKTLHDSTVNILRAGNEAFAAVLGGVQYLQVHAFNELEGTTPLAERLARNTQLILQQEAHLTNIVDPAGGSWYIESLTNELTNLAWEYFLTIDDNGGILAGLTSNWIQDDISAVMLKRQQDTFLRKQSIIGTNVYANLQEKYKEVKSLQIEEGVEAADLSIQPIVPQRLSESYELLRNRANHLKTNQVGLICLGELREFKARADFISGFLASGGIVSARSSSVNLLSEAVLFINENNFKHYVICSSNHLYSEFGLELMRQLKEKHPDKTFYLAGLPDKEAQLDWSNAGIKEFIHIGSNCHLINSSILTDLEEVELNGNK